MLRMNVTSNTGSADLYASRPHDLSDSIVSYTSSLGDRGPGICPLGCHLTLRKQLLLCASLYLSEPLSSLMKGEEGHWPSVASFCQTSDVTEMCLADVGIGVRSAGDEM